MENEFRVRPVKRYVVTHFQSDGKSGGVTTYGEFANLGHAEAVAQALHQTTPGSTYQTILKMPDGSPISENIEPN